MAVAVFRAVLRIDGDLTHLWGISMSDRPLVLLHCIHALSGGGAEKQLLNLSRAMTGVSFHIVYAEDRGALCSFPDNVIFHKLPNTSNYSPLLLLSMLILILRIKPDLIQTWVLKFDVIVGILRKILTFHWVVRESGSYEVKTPTYKNRLRLFLGSGANAIVANSDGGRRYWAEKSLCHRALTIFNGYDFDFLDSVSALQSIEKEDFSRKRICYIGRLESFKNADLLVRSMEGMGDNFELNIIGTGPCSQRLESMVDELALRDRVKLLGELSHGEAMSVLSSSDVLALLSDYEGTPNVVLEAMYLGVPVVLSSTASHRSFFPDEVAMYALKLSEREVVAALQESLLDNAERVKAGRKFAAAWSASRMAGCYEELYLQIITK